MDKQKLLEYRDWVRAELNASIKFWLEHGMDREHGGVYTCLDRKGEIYSTDKSVWMQGLLRMDLCLSLSCLRRPSRMAGGVKKLFGFYGTILHQSQCGRADVFHCD